MKYFTMRSGHSFPAKLRESELIFDWSQFPSEMLSLCEPVHELLTKLDLTGIDEDWERSALLKNGFCFPTQRIPLYQGIDEERKSVINRFFTTLISEPNSSMDLFDGIEKDSNDFPDFGSILEKTRSELGGRLIASPITIQHENETLEISGRIRPPSKNTPEFSKDLMKATGFVDSPSLWNNTVEVKTNSDDQKSKRITFHISVDQNLTSASRIKCNTVAKLSDFLRHDFFRCFPFQRLSRSAVHQSGDGVELELADLREVCALGQELA